MSGRVRKLTDEAITEIREMYSSGVDPNVIGEYFNVTGATVRKYTRDLRDVYYSAVKENEEKKPFNLNREGCKRCKYGCVMFGFGSGVACDYLEITGKRRGCPGIGCTKFEPGSQLVKPRKSITINFESVKRFEDDRYDWYGSWDFRKAEKKKNDPKRTGD